MNASELHQLLGAYVLGGLDPADSQRFEAHLKDCADCRTELAELESLPALLDALPVPDAVALTGSARPVVAPSQPAPCLAGSSMNWPPGVVNYDGGGWRWWVPSPPRASRWA
ncbi:anti-sigma-L factor RslA [Arthrobacter sp. Hiyo4]|nr:anti-sigma-L factor RslA [Arthrobacter sp. Hiyo4]